VQPDRLLTTPEGPADLALDHQRHEFPHHVRAVLLRVGEDGPAVALIAGAARVTAEAPVMTDASALAAPQSSHIAHLTCTFSPGPATEPAGTLR